MRDLANGCKGDVYPTHDTKVFVGYQGELFTSGGLLITETEILDSEDDVWAALETLALERCTSKS